MQRIPGWVFQAVALVAALAVLLWLATELVKNF
jgi:hypothetical protein